MSARAQFEQHIAKHTQDDAIGNGVGQHHSYDGDERRKCLRDILHVYLSDGLHHKDTHQYQCSGRGSTGDEQEDGSEEDGQEEHSTGDQRGKPGTPAFGNARSTLQVGGNRRTTQYGSKGGTDGIGQHSLFCTGNFAVLFHNPDPVGKGDQCADGVEHIHKEQREDNHRHIEREQLAEVELIKGGSQRVGRGDGQESFGNRSHTQRNADERTNQDAIKQGSLHLLHHEQSTQQDACQC